MDMPRIETLEQAKHFILGPKAYEGAPSPWKAPITSYQRPDSLIRENAASGSAQAPDSAPAAKVSAVPR